MFAMNVRKSIWDLRCRMALGRRMRTAVANLRSVITRRGVIEAYLRSNPVAKVQVGCGSNLLANWFNTDLVAGPGVTFVNAVKPLPFPASALNYVFTEHMFEHISYVAGQKFLREVYRVLKPGGIVRVSTPELAFLMRLYSDSQSDLIRRYCEYVAETFLPEPRVRTRCAVVNNFFYNWGHCFIYDFETLEHTLTAAGFVDVRRFKPKQSDDPYLRNLESHGKVIGEEFNALETIVVQARKP